MSQCLLLDLGVVEYLQALDMQRAMVERRSRNEIPDTLILLEHPHVYTVGKREANPIPADVSGVPVYAVERGGQWTYHGPGQLVGYPIISLEDRGRDIRNYLRSLEQLLIEVIRGFGIEAERHEGHTGVWVGEKKIASIGVAVRGWVAFHGFALNVNTELDYFNRINPCGLPGEAIISMAQLLGHEVPMTEVRKSVKRCFEQVFEITLEPVAPEVLALPRLAL